MQTRMAWKLSAIFRFMSRPTLADVWQHPELFKVGADYKPKRVAGVPPDYYSKTGQLWGNPVYDRQIHEQQGYCGGLAHQNEHGAL